MNDPKALTVQVVKGMGPHWAFNHIESLESQVGHILDRIDALESPHDRATGDVQCNLLDEHPPHTWPASYGCDKYGDTLYREVRCPGFAPPARATGEPTSFEEEARHWRGACSHWQEIALRLERERDEARQVASTANRLLSERDSWRRTCERITEERDALQQRARRLQGGAGSDRGLADRSDARHRQRRDPDAGDRSHRPGHRHARGLGGSVSVHLRYGILGWRWGSEKAEPSDVEYAAYPVALAEARERVIDAAREFLERPYIVGLNSSKCTRDALAALDALEAPDTEGGS